MATSRSLGTLTIDLLARVGGFIDGMSKAEREADRKGRDISRKQKARAKEVEKAWKDTTDNIGRILGTVGAAVAGGALFTKIATETANAQKEQALLAAALKATGNAAGYSLPRLNEMAGALESMTTFSAGEVNQAQTVLLGFTNIAGEQLPKALERAADFATRTGVSIASAAETMGRALDIPSAGMVSLQRQGFKFSESQIELAKQMERTGRLAEAQQLVFDALDETYGGAAVAARDTLGGAYTALQNTINSLLTGEGGSFRELQNSINSLTATLSGEQTRSAFVAFTSWIAEIANTVVKTAAVMKDAGFWGWLQVGADDAKNVDKAITETERKIKELQKTSESLSRPFSKFWNADDIAIVNGQIATLQAKLGGLRSMKKIESPVEAVTPSLTASFTPDLAFTRPSSVNLKDGAARSKSSGKSQIEKDAEAAAKYLENLKALAAGRKDLNTAEQLAYDIQTGKLKLDDKQREVFGLLADEADKYKDSQMSLAQEQERMNRLFSEGAGLTESLLTPTERYAEQIHRLNGLMGAGAIDAETYARAVDKYYKDMTDQSTDYTKKAAENMQTILGDWLYNGLQGSWDNLLRSFVQMLLKMEAQALAANIMGAITGGATGGGSILGGLFGGLFGGGRAHGGTVSPGKLYEVNEQGPELITSGGKTYLMAGSQAGYVTPAATASTTAGAGGGLSITVPVSVDVGGGQMDPGRMQAAGAQISKTVKVAVQDEVAQMLRPGGLLWAQGKTR